MKSVLLNNAGHTADGQWRLTPVEPDQSMIDAARDKYMAWHYGCGKEDVPLYYTPSDHFRAMIAASPAPELGEATDNRIAELEAENQALRADAERYRFVRVKACIIGGEFQILNMPSAGSEWRQKYDAAEQLDAAIDAAKGVDRG